MIFMINYAYLINTNIIKKLTTGLNLYDAGMYSMQVDYANRIANENRKFIVNGNNKIYEVSSSENIQEFSRNTKYGYYYTDIFNYFNNIYTACKNIYAINTIFCTKTTCTNFLGDMATEYTILTLASNDNTITVDRDEYESLRSKVSEYEKELNKLREIELENNKEIKFLKEYLTNPTNPFFNNYIR